VRTLSEAGFGAESAEDMGSCLTGRLEAGRRSREPCLAGRVHDFGPGPVGPFEAEETVRDPHQPAGAPRGRSRDASSELARSRRSRAAERCPECPL
jgi:hypothetical protein